MSPRPVLAPRRPETAQHFAMQHAIAAGDDRPALLAALTVPGRDHAAGRLDNRDQRLDVVGLERRLDDDVDETHRKEAVRVAVAAPACEAHPLLDAAERRAI